MSSILNATSPRKLHQGHKIDVTIEPFFQVYCAESIIPLLCVTLSLFKHIYELTQIFYTRVVHTICLGSPCLSIIKNSQRRTQIHSKSLKKPLLRQKDDYTPQVR